MPLAFSSPRRLALSATLSLAVLAGCQAPVVPPTASPEATPVPVAPQAPAASPEATAQPLQWTVIEGQATFKGRPLADKPVRVIDALTDMPAKLLGAGATTAELGESALAVQAEGELKTDAEGRYRLSIAGLQPGAAARIVVASGESGLTTLVPGSAVAGPKRYKVATNFNVGVSPITGDSYLFVSSGMIRGTTNEHSTLHSHLFNGAVALHELASRNNPAPPPPPVLIFPTQPISQPPSTGPVPLPPQIIPPQFPHLPNQLVAETDPLTGGLKFTEEMLRILEKQREETRRAQEEHLKKLAEDKQRAEETQEELLDQLEKLGEPGQGDPEALERRVSETIGPNEALKQQLAEIERKRKLQQQLQEQQKREQMRENQANLLNQIQQAQETLRQQNQKAQEQKKKEAEERLKEQLSEAQRRRIEESRYTQRHQDSGVKQALSGAGSKAKQSHLDMNAQALAEAAKHLKQQGPGQPPINVPLHGTGLNASIIDDGITVTNKYGKRLDVGQSDDEQLVSQLKQKFPTLTPRSSGGGSSGPAAPTPTPAAVLGVSTTADAAPSETLTEISLGAAPGDMVADDGAMWVALPSRNQVLRIPHGVADKSEIAIFDLPGSPQALTQASAGVVLAICGGDTLTRLEAKGSTVTSHQPDGVSGLKAMVMVGEAVVVANDSTIWFFLADEPVTSMGQFNAPATITGLAYGKFAGPDAPTLLVETTNGLYQRDDQEGEDLIPVQAVDETTDGVTEGVAKLTLLDSQYDRRLYAVNRATGKLITAAWDGGIIYRDLENLEIANAVSVDTGTFMWAATNGAQPVLHAVGLDQPVSLDIKPSKVRVDAADDVWITSETARKIRKIRGVQITQ